MFPARPPRFTLPLLCAAGLCLGAAVVGCRPGEKGEGEPAVEVITQQFYPVVSITPGLAEFERDLGCITNGHMRAFWNLVHPDALARFTPEKRSAVMTALENVAAYSLSLYHYDGDEATILQPLAEENRGGLLYRALLDCSWRDASIFSGIRLDLYEKEGEVSILRCRLFTPAPTAAE